MSASPSATTAADELVGRLAELAAALRVRDVRVGVGELLTAVRSVGAVDAASREEVRLALRATLCSRRSDLDQFDEAFVEVFGTGRNPYAADEGPLSELGSIET